MFQRSIACETVGAVGPNGEHFLHATNFGRMSPWIQNSEPPQKGQGSGCPEKVTPASPATLIGFRNILLQSHVLMAFAEDNAMEPMRISLRTTLLRPSREATAYPDVRRLRPSGGARRRPDQRQRPRTRGIKYCSRGCAVLQQQAPLSSGDQSYAEEVLEPVRTVHRVQFCICL